ncbi:helix-turn-helix domain-containing protein [Levilactobacillus fujinensis]|uniref:Helix-turn-helix domain-containing protein n=1 Tax=Levilactobacillus fujinensis TaxID=2486024 RepID=A0ABW1TDL8_9LACO|nr:helix-turn-helix domain-containing protein [Levilactobacillus fujinensis]
MVAMRIAFLVQRHADKGHPRVHNMFVIGQPILQTGEEGTLAYNKSMAGWGLVTTITFDEHRRFVIGFSTDKNIVLNEKNVATYEQATTDDDLNQVLRHQGYQLPPVIPTADKQLAQHLRQVLPTIQCLDSLPKAYVVVDCEFGILFRTQNTGSQIIREQAVTLGEKAGIFQLGALGYADDCTPMLNFNRYVDNPAFTPEMKLRGLRETGLTLAAYEQQAAPLAVLQAFIAQILCQHYPLVFWDRTNDLRLLRNLFAVHYDDLSTAEQRILAEPLAIFDGSEYTNRVITRSNHQRESVHHYLPLNGVAGLLNVFNPNQHNALWDAETTHYVVQELAKIHQMEPLILGAPQVISSQPKPRRTVSQSPATFQELRQAGQTYREIATRFGVSASTVWRAVKHGGERVN